MARKDYRLQTKIIEEILDQNDMSHASIATELGISKSHWSHLYRGQRPLTPRVRKSIRKHILLKTCSVDELWKIR
jgi:hypothetical protein